MSGGIIGSLECKVSGPSHSPTPPPHPDPPPRIHRLPLPGSNLFISMMSPSNIDVYPPPNRHYIFAPYFIFDSRQTHLAAVPVGQHKHSPCLCCCCCCCRFCNSFHQPLSRLLARSYNKGAPPLAGSDSSLGIEDHLLLSCFALLTCEIRGNLPVLTSTCV